MYVITVVPLKRGTTLDVLSYFGSTRHTPGTVVSIPLRNGTALGLVTGSEEVSAAKAALRAATFSLRRLPEQGEVKVLGDAFIKTAEELSLRYATSLGAILYGLLPPEVRNGEVPLPHTHYVTLTPVAKIEVMEARKKERHLAFRSMVRETFAHSGSVLLVAPSSFEAMELGRLLAPGIEERVIMLTSALTTSEMKRSFEALEDFSKTKLIIATPQYSMIERHDITLVIMEHAHSSSYKERVRPYLDYRDVLTTHAKWSGRTLVLADLLVRAEEEEKRRREIYQTIGELPRRFELPGELEVVEMNRKAGDSAPFQLFSERVIEAIKDTRKRKGHTFLFAARRGLAPLIACVDCGYIFRSESSGAPYSLVRTVKDGVEKRWFVSSSSGERIPAKDTCTACGSWRLRERGIGIQQVYDEFHSLFPNVPVILFDHMSARTYKKAMFLRDTFYNTKGSVLIGTPMVLPYLTEAVDLSVVVNMDALLSTPTWRLDEDNLAMLLKIREETNGLVYVQTRAAKSEILAHARRGSVQSFFDEELSLRKDFNYPPYAVLLHLTWQGAPDVVKKLESHLMVLLEGFPLTIYTSPSAGVGNTIMHGLIRIPREKWPDQKLVEKLRLLPPQVRFMLDPDRIV